MIRYKCSSCGTWMESPDGLVDKTSVCPICKSTNLVPVAEDEITLLQAATNPRPRTEVKDQVVVRQRPKARGSRLGKFVLMLILIGIGWLVGRWQVKPSDLPDRREMKRRRAQIIAEAKSDKESALREARQDRDETLRKTEWTHYARMSVIGAGGDDWKPNPVSGFPLGYVDYSRKTEAEKAEMERYTSERLRILAEYEKRAREIEEAYNRRMKEADQLLQR